jgi:hypothetical protein
MTVGDEYWMWQEQDLNGDWGMILSVIPAPGLPPIPLPLISRRYDHATVLLRTVAKAHQARTQQPIRLVHLVGTDVPERHAPAAYN